MYQLNLSINSKYNGWFEAIEESLNQKLKDFYGIMATRHDNKRTFVSIACENEFKQEVNGVIKDSLHEMYSLVCKSEYLKKRLKLPMLDQSSYNVLLHTLVAFDRESEKELIDSAINIVDGMAIDGIFNFKMTDLRDRWDDICALTSDNSMFLSDEATFDELLRFLISAINPKIMRLNLYEYDEGYVLRGSSQNGDFEIQCHDGEELLCYLIDLAPLELKIVGNIADKKLRERLTSIFDAKTNANNVASSTIH